MTKKNLISGVMHIVSVKLTMEIIRVDYKKPNGIDYALYAHRNKQTQQVSFSKMGGSLADTYLFCNSDPEEIDAFLICAEKAMDYFRSNK